MYFEYFTLSKGEGVAQAVKPTPVHHPKPNQ